MSIPSESGSDSPRGPLPPRVLPVYSMPIYPPGGGSSIGRIFLVLFLIASIGLNIFLLCGGYLVRIMGSSEPVDAPLHERFLSGRAEAADKVAVIRIDGPIVEGQLNYAHKQIESAAQNASVKAVVIRIDSPGGTISASD